MQAFFRFFFIFFLDVACLEQDLFDFKDYHDFILVRIMPSLSKPITIEPQRTRREICNNPHLGVVCNPAKKVWRERLRLTIASSL